MTQTLDDLTDHAPGELTERARLLAIGERVLATVLQHPTRTVLGIGVASGLVAMLHAETTIGRALPWGLAQAAAVVVGFVVLGPRLGLRPDGQRARRPLGEANC